ncbi:hypothetical protein PNOK_0852600 [Pyrrhoderma noxium]|uniref:Uncharacterized protein n=1 Tax=Pyrrhoderma noxium TaxID=2282107 RepID=A0A286U7X8_9AGAM|nr:hypothetical protein PNOK_0852600 [Pyrrhoderma noxium]
MYKNKKHKRGEGVVVVTSWLDGADRPRSPGPCVFRKTSQRLTGTPSIVALELQKTMCQTYFESVNEPAHSRERVPAKACRAEKSKEKRKKEMMRKK